MDALPSNQDDVNKKIAVPVTSIQLSPSTAVRTIVNDLLQHYVSSPTLSSKTNKRTRNEGKYGEEITSSSRLKELKEKESSSNIKKQSSKLTMEINITSLFLNNNIETTAKKRKLSKENNEYITLSQATRALTNLQASSSSNTNIDQIYTASTFQQNTNIM